MKDSLTIYLYKMKYLPVYKNICNMYISIMFKTIYDL